MLSTFGISLLHLYLWIFESKIAHNIGEKIDKNKKISCHFELGINDQRLEVKPHDS